MNEIMGVAAQLRDARRCKVVFILNENSLDDDGRDEFQQYAEKVIDMSFVFAPSPKEAATIAFPTRHDCFAPMVVIWTTFFGCRNQTLDGQHRERTGARVARLGTRVAFSAG